METARLKVFGKANMDRGSMTGYVFDHLYFPDGKLVRTSPVVAVHLDGKVETVSTLYTLEDYDSTLPELQDMGG